MTCGQNAGHWIFTLFTIRFGITLLVWYVCMKQGDRYYSLYSHRFLSLQYHFLLSCSYNYEVPQLPLDISLSSFSEAFFFMLLVCSKSQMFSIFGKYVVVSMYSYNAKMEAVLVWILFSFFFHLKPETIICSP